MTSQNMYINLSAITVCVAIFMALLAIGGILWRLAGTIGDIKLGVAVIGERLDGHIKTCGPQKSQS